LIDGLDDVMKQAKLGNKKGWKTQCDPVQVTGHDAPRKKGANGHPKMDGHNRVN
jgi:hypothetical protein